MNPNEIADYQSEDHRVIQASPQLIAKLGDEEAVIGSLVSFSGGLTARVVGQLGSRRVELQTLDGNKPNVGESVQVLGPAMFPSPQPGECRLSSLGFQADGVEIRPKRLEFADLLAVRVPLKTGWDLLDRTAPLVHGGLNLIIDQTGGDAALSLVGGLFSDPTVSIGFPVGTHQLRFETDYQQIMAFRLGMAWASSMREAGQSLTFLARVPMQSSDPIQTGVPVSDLSSGIAEALASSNEASITSFIVLPVPAGHGVAEIVETMSLGSFDAQVLIQEDGVVDLLRSTSNASLDVDASRRQMQAIQTLGHIQTLKEKTAIFGTHDLEQPELELLESADDYVVSVLGDRDHA